MTDWPGELHWFEADDGESLYAFVGTFGLGGLFVLSEGEWTWSARGSPRWDSLHQGAFRNHRFSSAEPPRDMPPFPEIIVADRVFHPPAPSDCPVPDAVADWVRAGGGQRRAVLLLREDLYESAHGDGRFLYPEGCFPSETACKAHLSAHALSGYAYHRRGVDLALQDGSVRLARITDGHWADRFEIEDVLARLAALLSGPT